MQKGQKYTISDFGRFIGYFTCHAVWSVESGEALCPFIVRQKGKERFLERHEGVYQDTVSKLKKELSSEKKSSIHCLIAYDGFITIGENRLDAILIESKAWLEEQFQNVVLAIPYRNARVKPGFAVHKPKLLKSEIGDSEYLMTEFWEGVYEHKKGAKAWDKALDESI